MTVTSHLNISSVTNAALDANDPAHDDDLKTAPVCDVVSRSFNSHNRSQAWKRTAFAVHDEFVYTDQIHYSYGAHDSRRASGPSRTR